jgi:hypothetical protein
MTNMWFPGAKRYANIVNENISVAKGLKPME